MATPPRGAVAVALVAAAATSLATPAADADRSRRQVFTIQPDGVDESSSLVVSTTHPGLVYTANDSGDSATVYVLDSHTGELVGHTDLAGVEPVDIEAMAAGSDGSLVVADIGDNSADRPETKAYRIDQPGRGFHVVTADSVSLTLSTGPRDAESALYDASSGRLFIVSKQFAGAHLYRSPPDCFSRDHAVMRPVRPAPRISTDATFINGGTVAAVRTYWSVSFYSFPGWRRLGDEDLPVERQGESVAASPDGHHLWIGSEGEHSPVLAVQIPDLTPATAPPTTTMTAPPPTSSTPGDSGSGDAHTQELKSRALAVGGVALALFALVAAIVAFRYHRHPREH